MKTNSFILLLIFLASVYYSGSVFSLTQNKTSKNLSSLKETIIALDVTRKKSQLEINKFNKIPNMSPIKNIDEFTIFVDYLSHQINKYCLQIYNQYGLETVSDLPCEIMKNKNNSPLSYDEKENYILTSEEKIKSLNNEFLNLLGDFDEMLLIEDELLAAKIKTNNSSDGKDNGDREELTGASTDKEKNSQSKQKDSSTEREFNNSKNEIKAQAKKQIPSTRAYQKKYSKEKMNEIRKLDKIEDDIVARQLKEAAEKETNPDLQEKLWEEYYKYKKKYIK